MNASGSTRALRGAVLAMAVGLLALGGCAASPSASTGAAGVAPGSLTPTVGAGGSGTSVRPSRRSLPPPRTRSATSGSGVPAASVRVGLGSAGGKRVVRVGDSLAVTLGPNWTAPRANASGGGVGAELLPLRVLSSVGYPVAGAASALFTAIRVGTADITARTDYACLHAQPACLPPVRTFSLRVVVIARAELGAGPLPQRAPS